MTARTLEAWILSLATLVTEDAREARRWYRSETIAQLDHTTAHELVQTGRGPAVVLFLLDVLRCELPAATQAGSPQARMTRTA